MSEKDPKDKQFRKFKKLDEEWRNDMMARPVADVDKAIRDAAMNLVTLELAKEFDEDLQQLKEQLKTANEQYTEGKKTNLTKIEFLIEVLRSRGLDVPGVEDFIKGATSDDDLEHFDGGERFRSKVGAALKGLRKGESITLSTPRDGKSVTIEGQSED